jgi:hypothetical protein
MEFIKTSDLLVEIQKLDFLITKQRSKYSLDSAGSRYVSAVGFLSSDEVLDFIKQFNTTVNVVK